MPSCCYLRASASRPTLRVFLSVCGSTRLLTPRAAYLRARLSVCRCRVLPGAYVLRFRSHEQVPVFDHFPKPVTRAEFRDVTELLDVRDAVVSFPLGHERTGDAKVCGKLFAADAGPGADDAEPFTQRELRRLGLRRPADTHRRDAMRGRATQTTVNLPFRRTRDAHTDQPNRPTRSSVD